MIPTMGCSNNNTGSNTISRSSIIMSLINTTRCGQNHERSVTVKTMMMATKRRISNAFCKRLQKVATVRLQKTPWQPPVRTTPRSTALSCTHALPQSSDSSTAFYGCSKSGQHVVDELFGRLGLSLCWILRQAALFMLTPPIPLVYGMLKP